MNEGIASQLALRPAESCRDPITCCGHPTILCARASPRLAIRQQRLCFAARLVSLPELDSRPLPHSLTFHDIRLFSHKHPRPLHPAPTSQRRCSAGSLGRAPHQRPAQLARPPSARSGAGPHAPPSLVRVWKSDTVMWILGLMACVSRPRRQLSDWLSAIRLAGVRFGVSCGFSAR